MELMSGGGWSDWPEWRMVLIGPLVVVWLGAVVLTAVFVAGVDEEWRCLADPSADPWEGPTPKGTEHLSLLPLGSYCTYGNLSRSIGHPADESRPRLGLNVAWEAFLVAVPIFISIKVIHSIRTEWTPVAETPT